MRARQPASKGRASGYRPSKLKLNRDERLHEAIENERENLFKADSLLGCLIIAMEYGSDLPGGPYYPDVAQAARELVKKSINGLDALVLHEASRNKVRDNHCFSFTRRRYLLERWAGRVHLAPVEPRVTRVRGLRLHRRDYGRALSSTCASAVSASANS